MKGATFHMVASTLTYPPGFKGLMHISIHRLPDYVVERVSKKDLPLYVSSPYVGPMMEKILKGKTSIK